MVVAHDAGAAEVIAAYIQKHAKSTDFVSYVAGPAERVFRRKHIPFHRISNSKKDILCIIKKYSNASYVLLGTGWMTAIEVDVLVEAKKINIKTVVYLDSWTNYKERFGYPKKNWKKNLPDELWVGDEYALIRARRHFKKIPIRFVPNQYFKNIVMRYKKRHRAVSPRTVFFVSGIIGGEEQLLQDILVRLSRYSESSILRIRFHPTDSRKRYDVIIKKYARNIRIQKSRESDIVEDLVRARVVIGTESMVMAVAALVGIKTVSLLSRGREQILPFPNILRAHKSSAAADLI